MQTIETDKGIFIDNLPDQKGFPWYEYVGQVVDGAETSESAGHKWLKKS